MVLINSPGGDLLNNTNLLDKAGDDTHTGLFTNYHGNVVAQGGLLCTVGDVTYGSPYINPRISLVGRSLIVPYFWQALKISATYPYWSNTLFQRHWEISIPYLFGVEPSNITQTSTLWANVSTSGIPAVPTCSFYYVSTDLSGSGAGPWAVHVQYNFTVDNVNVGTVPYVRGYFTIT